jgi:hypothetical protein
MAKVQLVTERSQLVAARRALRQLASSDTTPAVKELASLALGDVNKILSYRAPKFKLRPGVSYREAFKAHKERAIAPTKRNLTTKALKIAKQLEKDPRYQTIEFKCVDDFYKCRRDTEKNSAICTLAFFICLGRRVIPFVHT